MGQVVDTSGTAVVDAEVMALAGKTVVQTIKSDAQGDFALRDLPVGIPYTIVARKIGYAPTRGSDIRLQDGDTLRLRVTLVPGVVVLAPITVKGRRRHRSSLFADEFASKVKIYRDALNLIAWYRPYMLGDPEFCSPPDAFGRPEQDRLRFRITRNLSLFSLDSSESLRKLAARPWLDSLQYRNGFDDPSLPYVRQVYVNGLRVDRPGDPIRTPLRMLRDIPSEYVAEMHYVDCWNESVPIHMRYAIFVTLKPLSPEQQDYVSRYILGGAARPLGPIGGEVMSVKRPGQEAWDRILRSSTGRDSTADDSTRTETSQ